MRAATLFPDWGRYALLSCRHTCPCDVIISNHDGCEKREKVVYEMLMPLFTCQAKKSKTARNIALILPFGGPVVPEV
jgi:hypothetical protein